MRRTFQVRFYRRTFNSKGDLVSHEENPQDLTIQMEYFSCRMEKKQLNLATIVWDKVKSDNFFTKYITVSTLKSTHKNELFNH